MSRINPLILRFLAASAIALAVPVTALAVPNSDGRSPSRPHAMMRMLHGLDLTDSQKTQIRTLLEAQREQARKDMQQARQERRALRSIALSDHYDASAVTAGADRLAHAESDMAQQMTDTMHRIYALLTPEQQARFKERAAHHRPHAAARHRR